MSYHKSQRVSLCLAVKKNTYFHNFPPGCRFRSIIPWYFNVQKDGKDLFCKRSRQVISGLEPCDRDHATEWTGQHQALCGQGSHGKLWAGSQPVWLAPNYLKQKDELFSFASFGPKADAVTRGQSSQTPHIRGNISLQDTGKILPKTHRHNKRRHNFLSPFGQH